MSGTSSSSRSSTSGRGSFSSSRFERGSSRIWSPLRRADAAQRVGQLAHPLLVGPPDDERPHAVVHDVLDRHHLTGVLGVAGEDHVEALVEHDLEATLEQVVVDLGMQLDLHLAAAREDVDRAVVVLADDHAVRRRWLGQLVDLVAQRGDVFARLTERVAQLLVLADRLGELALGLEQTLLEGPDAIRSVGEACPQLGDLLAEHGDLSFERSGRFVFGLRHVRTLPTVVGR